MKKIYLFLCLLIVIVGTLVVAPTNIVAEADDRYATADDFLGNLSCGGTCFEFHKSLPNFTSTIYNILKIATPIIIVITGMLDLLKAVTAQKEDDIKKGQQKLLRRFLAGAVVFLVFVIVEATVHMFAENSEAENAMDCVDCFLNGANYCSTTRPASCQTGSGSTNNSSNSSQSNTSNNTSGGSSTHESSSGSELGGSGGNF